MGQRISGESADHFCFVLQARFRRQKGGTYWLMKEVLPWPRKLQRRLLRRRPRRRRLRSSPSRRGLASGHPLTTAHAPHRRSRQPAMRFRAPACASSVPTSESGLILDLAAFVVSSTLFTCGPDGKTRARQRRHAARPADSAILPDRAAAFAATLTSSFTCRLASPHGPDASPVCRNDGCPVTLLLRGAALNRP